MTHTDYTRNILNIKDENIIFDENCLEEIKINNIDTKVFHGKLTYTPTYCENCGAKNNGYNDIIKWNWKYNCTIKLPKISDFNTILVLDKQRFYCKHCDKTFIARTNVIGYRKKISNNTELSIKLKLMNKISEKDISKRFNVSHNKVNRIMHELSNKKILPGKLPAIMNFDEFKATKDTKGKMTFIITDTEKHKTFDILESRKTNYLKKYFYRFPRKQRLAVKFIIIDLFGPYYDLFKSIFPNTTIISDRFHIVVQANNALKCTRVQIMKKDKKTIKN